MTNTENCSDSEAESEADQQASEFDLEELEKVYVQLSKTQLIGILEKDIERWNLIMNCFVNKQTILKLSIKNL
jgi:predicted acetyltransferase